MHLKHHTSNNKHDKRAHNSNRPKKKKKKKTTGTSHCRQTSRNGMLIIYRRYDHSTTLLSFCHRNRVLHTTPHHNIYLYSGFKSPFSIFSYSVKLMSGPALSRLRFWLQQATK